MNAADSQIRSKFSFDAVSRQVSFLLYDVLFKCLVLKPSQLNKKIALELDVQ